MCAPIKALYILYSHFKDSPAAILLFLVTLFGLVAMGILSIHGGSRVHIGSFGTGLGKKRPRRWKKFRVNFSTCVNYFIASCEKIRLAIIIRWSFSNNYTMVRL